MNPSAGGVPTGPQAPSLRPRLPGRRPAGDEPTLAVSLAGRIAALAEIIEARPAQPGDAALAGARELASGMCEVASVLLGADRDHVARWRAAVNGLDRGFRAGSQALAAADERQDRLAAAVADLLALADRLVDALALPEGTESAAPADPAEPTAPQAEGHRRHPWWGAG